MPGRRLESTARARSQSFLLASAPRRSRRFLLASGHLFSAPDMLLLLLEQPRALWQQMERLDRREKVGKWRAEAARAPSSSGLFVAPRSSSRSGGLVSRTQACSRVCPRRRRPSQAEPRGGARGRTGERVNRMRAACVCKVMLPLFSDGGFIGSRSASVRGRLCIHCCVETQS